MLILGVIHVMLNGAPVRDAQICGVRALGIETPFRQLLASNDVVCGDNFPPGLWNVFARRGTSLVSSHTLLVDTRKPMPAIELRLVPAATIRFARPDGAQAFAYDTDTLSAFPAASDGHALVPAERDVVPLLAKNAQPIAIGEPLHLAANATQSVALSPSRGIATWIAIAPADLDALRITRRKQPPSIAATSGKKTVQSMNPIRGTTELNGAMQFIRDVPPGSATVTVSGAPWKSESVTVNVPPNGVVTTPSPLRLVPSSSAVVQWFARRNLLDLVRDRNTACSETKKPGAAEPTPVLSLLSCKGNHTAPALDLLDRADCKVIGEQEWARDEQSGKAVFRDLDPGTYVADFTFSDLPPVRTIVKATRFEETTVPLEIDYSTVYGRVTVGGEKAPSPVTVRFRFVTAVTTDADGNYTAVLSRPLMSGQVLSIRSCDGSVEGEEIVDRNVLPNSRYDIDLSANKVIVAAVDAESGAPVAGALVRYGAFRSQEMSSLYYFRLASTPGNETVPIRTDANGHYTIEHMPPGKLLRVCLEAEDYERTCPEPFQLTSTGEQTLKIPMRPNGFRGQITGVANVAAGQLYWFAPDGTPTETANVKADGAFRYRKTHEAGEVAVFVSLNGPLYAFPQPQLAPGDPMIVAMGAAPVRTFSVSIGEDNAQSDAVVTIAIGDLVVPYPPFAQHLALHGSQLQLTNRGPLLIPDILATGPLFAILGPPPDTVPPQWRQIDLFRLPQFR
ncbi:MAG TPA: carboxypeptidase-like regulatory domain-containing protein, partial [Thermoanaerobaculia bacterium]